LLEKFNPNPLAKQKEYGSSRVSVELAPQAGFGPPIQL
jgi:hypothetical protein